MKNIQSKHLFLSTFSLLALTILFNITACGNEKVESDDARRSLVPQSTQPTPSKPVYGKPHPEDFRTGHFYYGNNIQFGGFEVVRTKDSQLDSGGFNHLAILFDLAWDNDTAYTLTFKELLANPDAIELPKLKGMYRKCYMTDFTDSSYMEISFSTLTEDTIWTTVIKK